MRHCFTAVVLAAASLLPGEEHQTRASADSVARRVFALDLPANGLAGESAGGILVADVNDDGRMDFLITAPRLVLAIGNDGTQLWRREIDVRVSAASETDGLPGLHAPGLGAGDVDGDGRTEVVFLTGDSAVHVLDGATGRDEARATPAVPEGAAGWEALFVASFREGNRDGDLLLQATNRDGYRTGRYLAAFAWKALLAGEPPLWTSDRFVSSAHGGARLADLDGDGRDEILGATILSPEGGLLVEAAPFEGHIDSVFVADVAPEKRGQEVVLLEEGSNHVQVLGLGGVLWREHFGRQEPQNAAVGRFKRDSDEIFVWCRSRHNEHQKPFVFDSRGKVVFDYDLDAVAPKGWTASGVEVIHRIDWTGGRQQHAAAKERHTRGDAAIFEPLTGRFLERFEATADRLFVADVSGDWREEVIVLTGNELHVYENTAPNPRPDRPRLWSDHNYRRLKAAHNYYSP